MPDALLEALTSPLIATATRATVVLGVVALVQRFVGPRTSASVRHAGWAAALAVILVLPVAEMPGVRLLAPEAAQIAWHPPAPHVAPVPGPPRGGADLASASGPTTPAPSHPAEALVAEPAHTASEPARGPVPWGRVLVGLWAFGVLVGLARLAIGAADAVRRTWKAEPAPTLSRLAGVPIRRSDATDVPYAWGLVRPVIVVPASFDAWTEADRRAALAHEVAHVRRRDVAWGIVGRLALAVHWVNPLAHLAIHRLDREREIAADDAVLGTGVAPADYADLLVRTARQALVGRAAPSLALAHVAPSRSTLGERVRALLDPAAQRGECRRAMWAGSAALTALALGLSAFGTASHDTPEADGDDAPSWYRPPAIAERWAPRLHSPDGWTFTPTFTPDLQTAYFVLWHAPDYNDPDSSIQELYTARWSDAAGAWSVPERVAAMAGWRVDWPHVSPDGRLYLSSIKPHPGHYGYADGRSLPPRTADFDLWAAHLDADGNLDGATLAPLDSPDLNRQKTPANARIRYVHNETAPRTDQAGRLYFWTERLDDGGGRRDVYVAEPDGSGRWHEPELMPFNTEARESGIAVDPAGQWLIFASEGRGGQGGSDLFVVAREGDGWGEPVNLGPEVNTANREDSPEVSPDGQALFFSTNRPGRGVPTVDAGEGAGPAASVYWVDLGAVPAFARTVGPRP